MICILEPGTNGEKIIKPDVAKPDAQVPIKQPTKTSTTISLSLLSNLQEIRRRLEIAESSLTDHLHIPLGDNNVHECSVHIQNLQVFWLDYTMQINLMLI